MKLFALLAVGMIVFGFSTVKWLGPQMVGMGFMGALMLISLAIHKVT